MKIGIGLYTEEKKHFISTFVHSFESDVNNYLKEKNYGSDIEMFGINLTIINPSPGFEHFYKVYKPKYVAYKEVANPYTKKRIEIIKEFIVSVRIDGELYHQLSPDTLTESQKIVVEEILKSFLLLEFLPKKVKDFDRDRFISDMADLMKEKYGVEL